jgi:hypothetical protein
MPYVAPDRRPALDTIVEIMALNDIKIDGDLNYILYAYCKRHVKPSYNNLKNYLGELNECSEEIRRTILGSYEEIKRKENGNV